MPGITAVEHLGRLLQQLPCGALLIDRTGRVLGINQRLRDLLQRPDDILQGEFLSIICSSAEEHELIERMLGNISDDGREQEHMLPLPNGMRLPVLTVSRQLPLLPILPSVRLIVVLDLSKQKQTEEGWKRQYEIIARLSNRVFDQAEQLRDYSKELEDRVRERTIDLHQANLDAIHMLAIACEAKDSDTGAHVLRIQRHTHRLARALGLNAGEAEAMALASVLHDVGKLHVPDNILKKPGPLTNEERTAIQEHTIVGERILADKPFFERARKIARSHHENWDGTGYPDHIAGDTIPMEARIVHLVDVYDALTTSRVYKKAWSSSQARDFIVTSRNRLFDPEIVDAFAATPPQ